MINFISLESRFTLKNQHKGRSKHPRPNTFFFNHNDFKTISHPSMNILKGIMKNIYWLRYHEKKRQEEYRKGKQKI